MTPAVRSSPRRASASSAMRLGARWPQDAGRLRGMSLPPNGDEGDEGSARARRPAPCDRARGIRGAIGVETAAHAAVAMARVVAFKPAVGCGGRGRDGQFGLRIPKDSTGGVGSNGLATRAARGSTRGRRVSPPVASTHMYRGSRVAWPQVETGVSARACPPGRVPKRVGERGGKKKRASPNRRPRSRPRREATPARDAEPRTGCALTSRVRTNVPRAFRANGCASRVCRRGEAPVVEALYLAVI